MRRKTFKKNDEYFKFFNENKDKINVLKIETKDKIKIIYEVLNENINK